MQSQLIRFGISRLLGACGNNASITETAVTSWRTAVAAGQRLLTGTRSVSGSPWLASAAAAPQEAPRGSSSASVRRGAFDLAGSPRFSRQIPERDILLHSICSGRSLVSPGINRCQWRLRLHPLQQRPPATGSPAHGTGEGREKREVGSKGGDQGVPPCGIHVARPCHVVVDHMWVTMRRPGVRGYLHVAPMWLLATCG